MKDVRVKMWFLWHRKDFEKFYSAVITEIKTVIFATGAKFLEIHITCQDGDYILYKHVDGDNINVDPYFNPEI